ncbi:deoxynucleoside kinase [Mycoplasmatota bacterium WC44]
MNKELLKKYNIPEDAVITIAGTVGVGKSTFTRVLSETLGFMTSYENVTSNPYLEKYYGDFEKWSFHLQIFFLAERFKEQKRMFHHGGGFIQDRSIYEDVDIFAKLNYQSGTMTKDDYETYKSLFEAMVLTPFFPHPDLVIFIDGELDDILKRINERGRAMEIDTPVEYWKMLHKAYREWIDSFHYAPVLRLNIKDFDLLNDSESVDFVLNKIGKVISATSMTHQRKNEH